MISRKRVVNTRTFFPPSASARSIFNFGQSRMASSEKPSESAGQGTQTGEDDESTSTTTSSALPKFIFGVAVAAHIYYKLYLESREEDLAALNAEIVSTGETPISASNTTLLRGNDLVTPWSTMDRIHQQDVKDRIYSLQINTSSVASDEVRQFLKENQRWSNGINFITEREREIFLERKRNGGPRRVPQREMTEAELELEERMREIERAVAAK